MSGMASVGRRAAAGSGRSRRNMYSAVFETDPADQASGIPLTGGIFKNAAFEILKQEERLMTSGEITKLAMERRLLRCTGKTPENTMASALYTEVRRKARTTVFIKPKEGLFGLKAWLNEPWLLNWLAQEGIDVADLQDPGGAVEPMPKKVRTSYNGAASRAAGGAFNPNHHQHHRTSSNGGPLMRSSSAGFGSSADGAAGGHRASFNGQALAPGGGGGGSRPGSFTSLGSVLPSNASMPKLPYGHAVAANGMTAAAGTGGILATGTVSDALSSLHLLVDAADEIEGGPECDQAGIRRPPLARRRSDGLLQQTSFQCQRPPVSRETSLPSMIARVRVRDEFEEEQEAAVAAATDEEDGEEEEEEEETDDTPADGDDVVTAAANAAFLEFYDQRRQSSNRLHVVAAEAAAVESYQEQQRAYRQGFLQQQNRQRRRNPAAVAQEEEEEEDSSDEEGSDQRPACQLQSTVDGAEAKSVRWASRAADLTHRHQHHQHPGVYRGLRGGRMGGRNAVTEAGVPVAATAPAHAPRSRMRSVSETDRLAALDVGADRSDETEEEEGEEDEEDGGQVGSRAGQSKRGQQRRWASTPRAGGAARRGAAGWGGRRTGRVRQPRGAEHDLPSRRQCTEEPLPVPIHEHMPSRGRPGEHVPMIHMPGSHMALHTLHRLAPGAVSTAAALDALLAGGPEGHGGAASRVGDTQGPIPDHLLDQLRAALASSGPMGFAAMLQGLGLGISTAQLQAHLGSQLEKSLFKIGLPGLDVGSLLGDVSGIYAASTATGATGGSACGCPLPPALARIWSVLGRSPQLAASLVSGQRKIAEMGNAAHTLSVRAVELTDDDGRADIKTDPKVLMSGDGGPVGGGSCGGGGKTSVRRRNAASFRQDLEAGIALDDVGERLCAEATQNIAALGFGGTGTGRTGTTGEAATEVPLQRQPSQQKKQEQQEQQERQQQQQLEDALLRAPSRLSPVGFPTATVVAVHDAMNSPDSQLAVGADRVSSAADEALRSCAGDSDSPAVRPAAGQQNQPAEQPPGPPPGHPTTEPLAQLMLLQQQHLKLLLPVEAARPGDVPDPGSINRIRQQVLDIEARMGPLHPEAGRAYVLLARVLEHKGTCWSLTMAERALMRAWTIVSVVSNRQSSDGSAATAAAAAAPTLEAVASAGSGAGSSGGSGGGRGAASEGASSSDVAEAAAAEAGAGTPGEVLAHLPDSFHTFQYLLQQIRVKQTYLQEQQEQQLLALLRMVATVAVPPGPGAGIGMSASSLAAGALANRLLGGAPVPGGGGDGLFAAANASAHTEY